MLFEYKPVVSGLKIAIFFKTAKSPLPPFSKGGTLYFPLWKRGIEGDLLYTEQYFYPDAIFKPDNAEYKYDTRI
jgi:hypothetical protein